MSPPGCGRPPPRRPSSSRCRAASRSEGRGWSNTGSTALDATGRYALIKLVAGGLRIGVSARLAKQALALYGGKDVNEIEEVWHGLSRPISLFAWLEGRGDRPAQDPRPVRPVMLSHALANAELALITPEDYAAEWKWDGIRVQAVSEEGVARLYTRTADDISAPSPIWSTRSTSRARSTASC